MMGILNVAQKLIFKLKCLLNASFEKWHIFQRKKIIISNQHEKPVFYKFLLAVMIILKLKEILAYYKFIQPMILYTDIQTWAAYLTVAPVWILGSKRPKRQKVNSVLLWLLRTLIWIGFTWISRTYSKKFSKRAQNVLTFHSRNCQIACPGL